MMRVPSRILIVPLAASLALLLRGCAGTDTGNPTCAGPSGSDFPGRAERSGEKWGVSLTLGEVPGSSGPVIRVVAFPLEETAGKGVDSPRRGDVGDFEIDLAWGPDEAFVDEDGSLQAHYAHAVGDHIVAVRPRIRGPGGLLFYVPAMDLTLTRSAELTATLHIARHLEDGGIDEDVLSITGPVYLPCSGDEIAWPAEGGVTFVAACTSAAPFHTDCDDTPEGWPGGCSVGPSLARRLR
jgi:hypothetical protein